MVDRKREKTFGDGLFSSLEKNKRQTREREERVRRGGRRETRRWHLRRGGPFGTINSPVGTCRGGPQAQQRTAPVPTYHKPPTSSATAGLVNVVYVVMLLAAASSCLGYCHLLIVQNKDQCPTRATVTLPA